jgi:hypothetical protein
MNDMSTMDVAPGLGVIPRSEAWYMSVAERVDEELVVGARPVTVSTGKVGQLAYEIHGEEEAPVVVVDRGEGGQQLHSTVEPSPLQKTQERAGCVVERYRAKRIVVADRNGAQLGEI